MWAVQGGHVRGRQVGRAGWTQDNLSGTMIASACRPAPHLNVKCQSEVCRILNGDAGSVASLYQIFHDSATSVWECVIDEAICTE